MIITDNYGQAAAIDRYGPQHHLPAVYSGHNGLLAPRPTPRNRHRGHLVGCFAGPTTPGPCPKNTGDRWTHKHDLTNQFATCQTATTLDNHTGIDNEEGAPVRVCRNPRTPCRSRPFTTWATPGDLAGSALALQGAQGEAGHLGDLISNFAI